MVVRSPTSPLSSSSGFTLVELMIVVVILAVLTTIAVPTFRDFIVQQRARATVADLRIALMTARSEAVKRNRDVAVTATGGDWKNGWTIASPVSGEPNILNHVQAGAGDVAITGSLTSVGFKANGRTEASGTFEVKVGSGSSSVTKCLTLKTDGRSESMEGTCS